MLFLLRGRKIRSSHKLMEPKNKFLGFRIKNQQLDPPIKAGFPLPKQLGIVGTIDIFSQKILEGLLVPPFDRFAVLSFQPINLIPKDQNNSDLKSRAEGSKFSNAFFGTCV